MIRAAVCLLLAVGHVSATEQLVVDFEQAVPLLPDTKANRVPRWEEKGVVFTLAGQPQMSKSQGMLMFFTHLATGHKGILCAMATEPIPVRATFPKPVSSATLALWGSTGVPALLEAFDADGKVVDRVRLESAQSHQSPGDPVPIFTMTVNAKRIAYLEFSGPREGECLVADEVRFTNVEDSRQ